MSTTEIPYKFLTTAAPPERGSFGATVVVLKG